MKKFLFLTIAAFAFVIVVAPASAAVSDTCEVDLTAYVGENIDLACSVTSVDLGTVVPGTPVVGSSSCTVTTNADLGYDLLVRQDTPLTDNESNTIAAYAGTIGTPTAWTGTGLGFSVYASTATKDAKWGSASTCTTGAANNYAGFPGTSAIIMDHDSYSATATTTDICYKLDVPSTQESGAYAGQVTYTATTKP
ncbi:MAG TPA: hypothetical protein P5548_04360 [Candidatus Moranbacteria bacterium]|nr:hypothetical protein [Candidatus Moranbacteria bacterium]HRZ34102.1 hypothetical protein [Candidatus Moranbacteria bacterium]